MGLLKQMDYAILMILSFILMAVAGIITVIITMPAIYVAGVLLQWGKFIREKIGD